MNIALPQELQAELDNMTEEASLSKPFHVETGEAADVAAFCRKRFADEVTPTGKILHRGLNSVANPARGFTEF